MLKCRRETRTSLTSTKQPVSRPTSRSPSKGSSTAFPRRGPDSMMILATRVLSTMPSLSAAGNSTASVRFLLEKHVAAAPVDALRIRGAVAAHRLHLVGEERRPDPLGLEALVGATEATLFGGMIRQEVPERPDLRRHPQPLFDRPDGFLLLLPRPERPGQGFETMGVLRLEQAFADADRRIVVEGLESLLRLLDERLQVALIHFRISGPPAESPFYIFPLRVIMNDG